MTFCLDKVLNACDHWESLRLHFIAVDLAPDVMRFAEDPLPRPTAYQILPAEVVAWQMMRTLS